MKSQEGESTATIQPTKDRMHEATTTGERISIGLPENLVIDVDPHHCIGPHLNCLISQFLPEVRSTSLYTYPGVIRLMWLDIALVSAVLVGHVESTAHALGSARTPVGPSRYRMCCGTVASRGDDDVLTSPAKLLGFIPQILEPQMTGPLLHTWNLNLGYAKRLVADIPDDEMALQPAPGMNHAAWVLGHLACTADMLGAMIGLKPVCSPEWPSLFDWNSSPFSDASLYPSKATLLKALEDAHAEIAAALPNVPESRWAETTPLEAVRGFLPTMGDCFVFVMAAHENMHLGQLSAWRRVKGMERV